MKTVSLDVHSQASQFVLAAESGEVLMEMKVATEREALRAVVGAVPGPKRVVFEEGPLSAALHDWLSDLCEEVISADPSHNARIAQAEDASDERDARRLAELAQLRAVHPVYVAPEPFRTLRSLLGHDLALQRHLASVKNRIGALCRRHRVGGGRAVYWREARAQALAKLPNAGVKWQLESLYRQLDLLRRERVAAHRLMAKWAGKLSIVGRLQTAPGIGPITSRTIVGWVADPFRFPGRNQVTSYGGLGMGQGTTNWKPIGRCRASKRGNRQMKRVLIIAAKAASKTDTALGRRYAARIAAGWRHDKAIRDVARTLLQIAWTMWKKGVDYDDRRVAELSED